MSQCPRAAHHARPGRDSIAHPPGGHDDIANALAGACLAAIEHAGAVPAHRLQSRAIDGYDPLATPEENMVALPVRSGALATSPGQAGRRPEWVMIERSNTGLTEMFYREDRNERLGITVA